LKEILEKADKYLTLFENASVVVFLSVASILAFVEVVLRYAFFTSITWSSEIVVLSVTWAVFIGLSMALRKGAHIKVEVVVDLLSGNKKFTVVLFSTIIGVIFALFLFFFSIKYAAFLKESGERSITTDIPEYLYFLALPMGGFLFSIRYIQEIFRVIKERRKGEKFSTESKETFQE
jgi:C4-dicarboxylate transporter DctQ subunit